MVEKECIHRETVILKSYRKNYTHGTGRKLKKVKAKCFNPPKRCTYVCVKCGKKLGSWKPVSSGVKEK